MQVKIDDLVQISSKYLFAQKYNGQTGVVKHVLKDRQYWCWVEFADGKHYWFPEKELQVKQKLRAAS